MPGWLSNVIAITLLLVTVVFVTRRLPKVEIDHSDAYMKRRRLNWLVVGLTYAFLYMGRYNLTVASKAGVLPTSNFSDVFAVGTVVYGLAVRGPRARELADLLVAVPQVHERAAPRVELLTLRELGAGVDVVALLGEHAPLVKERLGGGGVVGRNVDLGRLVGARGRGQKQRAEGEGANKRGRCAASVQSPTSLPLFAGFASFAAFSL